MRPTTSYGTAGHGPTGLLRKTPAKFPVVGSTVKTFKTETRWPCQTAGCRPWAKDPATDTRRRKKAATMRYIFSARWLLCIRIVFFYAKIARLLAGVG